MLKNIINEVFISKDMNKYLTANSQKLRKRDIIDMVCSVPIELKRKSEILEMLAKTERYYVNATPEMITYETLAETARYFLNELILKPGELFCLCTFCNENNSRIQIESIPFYSYEKVLEFLENDDYDKDSCWHILEKWIPDANNNLIDTIHYHIIDAKVCYFYADYNIFKNTNLYRPAQYFLDGSTLNLPVPFKAGDIITIDCRPFYPIKHVTILEVGDNRDCCCLTGLYLNSIGNIAIGAIKHNNIFGRHPIYPWIPALYKAEKYNDVLPESEEFLSEVSTWMDHNEQKGQLLWNYIFEHDNDGNGVGISRISGQLP